MSPCAVLALSVSKKLEVITIALLFAILKKFGPTPMVRDYWDENSVKVAERATIYWSYFNLNSDKSGLFRRLRFNSYL